MQILMILTLITLSLVATAETNKVLTLKDFAVSSSKIQAKSFDKNVMETNDCKSVRDCIEGYEGELTCTTKLICDLK
jgi:hypothetical protein